MPSGGTRDRLNRCSRAGLSAPKIQNVVSEARAVQPAARRPVPGVMKTLPRVSAEWDRWESCLRAARSLLLDGNRR